MENEKVLTSEDLKKRFVKLAEEGNKAQEELGKMKQTLQAKQMNISHIQGALQDTVELLSQLVGQEEVKKFIDQLNAPQDEQQN